MRPASAAVDEIHLLDSLRRAVFEHFEILRVEIGNKLAVPILRDDVDFDDVCRRAKRWRRLLRLRETN